MAAAFVAPDGDTCGRGRRLGRAVARAERPRRASSTLVSINGLADEPGRVPGDGWSSSGEDAAMPGNAQPRARAKASGAPNTPKRSS
ncbi:hypothetical protein KFE25_012564 [Diacronema lutheri]|uniref:Uncharacterized protein n=1 Tax=Diacronema lutheri TaxID=2081491 RepID=A0A8J6CBL0_DIALT|nr:hypothetical protein KFE25_012564 [Diacronema lutheri]